METFAATFDAQGLILGQMTRDHAMVGQGTIHADGDVVTMELHLTGPSWAILLSLARLRRRYGLRRRDTKMRPGSFQGTFDMTALDDLDDLPIYSTIRKHMARGDATFRFASGMCTVQFDYDTDHATGTLVLEDLRNAMAAARVTSVVRMVEPSLPAT